MQTAPTVFSKLMAPGVVVALMVAASTTQAQPPRQSGQGSYDPRAQQACDAAASRYGYQVMRRDRQSVNGNTYSLPMHVSHAGTEADVTCQYDPQRNVAMVPRWDDRDGRPGDYDRDDRGNRGNHGNHGNRGYDQSSMAQQAESACQNYVHERRGYQVLGVGEPTRHGRNQYDVPVTVRRNGRRESTVTCRYNAANNKLSLR